MRRRLVWASAPLAVAVVVVAVKLISAVLAGNAAVSNFADGDTDALRGNVSRMSTLNIVEPAKAPFAAGALAVLQNRLVDADRYFSDALARTPTEQTCPVLVNLELVRERQGDIDAWENRPAEARDRYLSALDLVTSAPAGCFEANSDPDSERRAVRADAAPRLSAKLAGLDAPPPPPPPPPAAAPVPPPPPAAAAAPESPENVLRLNPGAGDPLDKLRQVLRDGA
ncbi:hypothetical protein BHQ18_21960 [Mycolicibacterium flavescens]|uniref:Tetratricopeptide repeat protein n=1 Tax=Mycolicibacterium flavescens TaxID=1776 RepID=A0A1E3RDD1_MYCFV|nr:hypothetical protein BHQ18_21960 [Mycolicibacterium flavescens]